MYYCELSLSIETLPKQSKWFLSRAFQETTLYGATVKINEPMGVIAIACPDDYPLLGFVSLFAPAVIRGNAVVIVPSEACPVLALDLYQVGGTRAWCGLIARLILERVVFCYLMEIVR